MKTIKFSGCDCEITKGKFDINKIPLNCRATWNLVSSGYTNGIFQLETHLGQQWASKIKPQSMDELAALIAIVRPAALESGQSEEYVRNKFNPNCINYIHSSLKPILENTHGSLVFQEQSLKIAADIAGFSMEEGDNLRKGIGKKDAKLISELKNKFIDGCAKKNIVSKAVAEELFGWIEKGQRYQFNKSHSVAYAFTGYQTAYLKCHFPTEFFASFLTYSHYKSKPKEEICKLVQDARLFGINILPPDVRSGNIHFKILDDSSIAFGLSHIRGVGQSAINKIRSIKIKLNAWKDFFKACQHLSTDVSLGLIKSGACDCYNIPRNRMSEEVNTIFGKDGLTDKELAYFLEHMDGEESTCVKVLEDMYKIESTGSLKSFNKEELQDLINKHFLGGVDSRNMKKQDMIDYLLANGFKEVKAPYSNDKRREVIKLKANKLKEDFYDTNTGKAMAEKHYLGISLSCSEADDADNSMATHKCIDIATEKDQKIIKVCAIIDDVKKTKTKKGKNIGAEMCFITMSDSTYYVDKAVVFPDTYEELKDFCEKDLIGLFTGTKSNGSFIIKDIVKLL